MNVVMQLVLGLWVLGVAMGFGLKFGMDKMRRYTKDLFIVAGNGNVEMFWKKARGDGVLIRAGDKPWWIPLDGPVNRWGPTPVRFVEPSLGHPFTWTRVAPLRVLPEGVERGQVPDMLHLEMQSPLSSPHLSMVEKSRLAHYPAWKLAMAEAGKHLKAALQGGGFDIKTIGILLIILLCVCGAMLLGLIYLGMKMSPG